MTKRRRARAGELSWRDEERAALAAKWRLIPDESYAVDGKRLARDLGRVYRLTGDPIFHEARILLGAHGLDGGEPRRSEMRYLGGMPGRESIALTSMRDEIVHAQKHGAKLSIVRAAERAAVRHGIGPKFSAAAKRLRLAYGKHRKSIEDGRFSPRQEDAGTTSRRIWVTPVRDFDYRSNGLRPLPAEGREEADALIWRFLFYRGFISVRSIV